MRTIKLGLSGLKQTALVAKAENVVLKMTDNANFATPSPTLAEVTQATDELRTAIAVASNGDRFAILERNNKAAALTQLMRLTAYYVSSIGDGNGEILASSGFDLKRESVPSSPVTSPIDFLAVRDALPGSVKLNWKAVTGAKAYIVETTTTDPVNEKPNWLQAAITTQSRTVLDNLTISTYYWYRVRAVGIANESPWSDVSLVLVA